MDALLPSQKHGVNELAFSGRAVAELEQFTLLPGKLRALGAYLADFVSIPLVDRITEIRASAKIRNSPVAIVTTHPLSFVYSNHEISVQILIRSRPSLHAVVLRLFVAPLFVD